MLKNFVLKKFLILNEIKLLLKILEIILIVKNVLEMIKFIGKINDYYEFHIESVGIHLPKSLFYKELNVLKNKDWDIVE